MLSEAAPLTRVVVKHARDAFNNAHSIAAQWRALNFTEPPDLGRAIEEHDRFVEILQAAGATVDFLPRDESTTLDSIYARDASIVSPRGMILCRMGKAAREPEPEAQARAFAAFTVPLPVVGRIEPPGRVEGGDVLWLDEQTIVVGRGYRTNAEGIRQLRLLLGESITHLIEVPLPHWRGPSDVMHLMSLISPVAERKAVVYSRLMPVPFREWLLERDYQLIETPDDEFESMGTNVLALAPDKALMLAGNPGTKAALERAGVDVVEYEGREISVKGAGGPTCLTRPIERLASR